MHLDRTGSRRRHQPATAASLSLALLAVLAGCGDQDSRPTPSDATATVGDTWREDLLKRTPSRVIQERAALAAEDDAWAAAARWTLDEDEPGLLPSGGATLVLDATGSEARTLAVTADELPSATTLDATLNGIALGTITLARRGEAVELEAPAEAWFVGENVLELRGADGPLEGLVIEELRYGIERTVDWPADGDAAELAPNSSVEFVFELPAPAALEGRVSTEGDGILAVTSFAMQGLDGALTEIASKQVDVFEQAIEIDEELLRSDEGPTLVRVEWRSAEGAPPLRVERLVRVETEAAPRPPIVFLSIDTLAARNMSVYGYERDTTPNLAAFAEQCVTFDAAKSNAPWTIPSYSSQLSGMHPLVHFVGDQIDQSAKTYERFVVAPNRWTLAESLSAAGYETHAIVDNGWMALVSGILQGFQTRDTRATDRPLEDQEGGMRLVLPAALEWLADREDGGFFLMAQILDTHGPYLPGPKWRGKFGSDAKTGTMLPVVQQTPPTYGGIPDSIVPSIGAKGAEDVPFEPIVAAYDEKIAEMDSEVGRFLADLQKHPQWDEMIVIISADHGESMSGQEFYFRHGILFEHTLNVPLMVRLPGGERGGERITDTVDLLGLYPTLLEVLGLPHERPYLDGVSFAPALRGESIEPVTSIAAGSFMQTRSVEKDGWKILHYTPYSGPLQTILTHPPTLSNLLSGMDGLADRLGVPDDPEQAIRILCRPGRVPALEKGDAALKKDIKKYLRKQGPKFEVFYLPRDPEERKPMKVAPEEIQDELLMALGEMELYVEEARKTGSVTAVRMQLSDAQLEELRVLGYLEEDEEQLQEDPE